MNAISEQTSVKRNQKQSISTNDVSDPSLRGIDLNGFISLVRKLQGNDSLSAFARKAGLSKGNLSRILNKKGGERPKVGTIRKLFLANPNTGISLNDLLVAAGYPQVEDAAPGIPLAEFQKFDLKIQRPMVFSSIHVAIDYLEQTVQTPFSLYYDQENSFLQIKFKDICWYFFSAIIDNFSEAPAVSEKASQDISALLNQNPEISIKNIFLITNSESLFKILKTYIIKDFNVLYTQDNLTVADKKAV